MTISTSPHSPTQTVRGATDLTVFDSKSFIPLLAVQQRPHSRIYAMPARDFDCAADAAAASVAARSRLRNGPLRIAKAVEAVEVAVQPLALPPLPVEPPAPGTAPLNMLAPCSWKFLLALAAIRGKVKQSEILSVCRTRRFTAARYDAQSLTYQHTQHSHKQIGALFGRDYSTVMHGCRKLGRTKKLVDRIVPIDAGRPPYKVRLVPPSKAKMDWQVRS